MLRAAVNFQKLFILSGRNVAGGRPYACNPIIRRLPLQGDLTGVVGVRSHSGGSTPTGGEIPQSNASKSGPAPRGSEATPQAKNKPKKKSKNKKKVKAEGKAQEQTQSQTTSGPAPKKQHKQKDPALVALIDAINDDDWPSIIKYSSLPEDLADGWHPDESEWLASHRMSMAMSHNDILETEDVYDSAGVISTEKLARVWARDRKSQAERDIERLIDDVTELA